MMKVVVTHQTRFLRRATILSLFFCLIPIGYYSYDGHKYFTSVFSTSLGQSSGFNLR